jgi:hypothetical protein
VTGLRSLLGAPWGPGDPYLTLWTFGWDLRTISTHPTWLLTGRVFDANIFHPSIGTLAYSDHHLLQALAIWPLYALTGSVPLCVNAVLLLSLALSAWAMFAFVRSITGSTIAAYGAALVWGFCPYHITQLSHLALQSLYWMPLSFWRLHRLVAGWRTRDAVWLGIVLALQAVSSVYVGMIGAIGVLAAAAVLVTRSGRCSPQLVARFALVAVIAIVVAAPGLWPYWRVQQREGFGRTVFEAEHNSAFLSSYLQAPPLNFLYGRSGWFRPKSAPTPDEPEQDLFPGVAVLALAVVGLQSRRKQRREMLVASMLAVAATGLLLSLGPHGIRPLYSALHDRVFGFQAIRAPARFSLLVFFALAVLTGVGLESIVRPAGSRRPAPWLGVVALVFVGADFFNGSIAFAQAPARSTDLGRWLRTAPEPGPVLYLPIGTDADDSTAMVASLEHGRPIINGHSGQRPAIYPAIVEQVSGFPDPISLLTLRELGVRFVVAPAHLPRLAAPSPLIERAAFDGGVIYELRWTPEIDAAFDAADAVVMLPPGRLPFGTRETSRYRVRWLGGPVTLPAGDAIVSAERSADGGFHFDAHATTAAWVRSFFAADDQLSAETDAQLLPRVYRESLNEGRRRARRIVTFDPAGRRVTVINGDTAAVALPLRPGARDPLSALFYVRTLPLEPGRHIVVLVNDAGRHTTVDVGVVGAETITIDGRSYDTWKVAPTLVTRLAWRTPPRATVWISRDDRKIPVRITVSAAFGTVDVELIEYQGQ